MQSEPKIPREIVRLVSASGFIEAFYEFLPITDGDYRRTFEYTNAIYEEWFGADRYSDYDSFRKILERKHKEK